MPRGKDPNSLKALEENRAATQFKKGEKKSAEDLAKRSATFARRKSLREELELMLQQTAGKDNDGKSVTVQEALSQAIIKKAIKGDVRAYEVIRDTIGEKPIDKVQLAEIDEETVKMVEGMILG